MLKFLRHVLPQEGYKCRTIISPEGKTKNTHYQTIEQLANGLLEADASGKNTYFACSTFKTTESRKQENVLGAKSFWLDLDAGIDPKSGIQKDYLDADTALSALDEFMEKLGFDPTTAVRSGYGIHGWITMDRFIHAAEWTETAKVLKVAADRLGLKADPSRTADRASILRCPGTHNFKVPTNPIMVSLEEGLQDPIDFDKFKAALEKVTITTVSVPSGVASAALGGIKTGSKPDMTQGFPDGYRTEALQKRAGWLLGPGGLSEEETLAQIRVWNQFNDPPMDDAKLVHDVHSYALREQAKHPQVISPVQDLPPLPKGFFWGKSGELLARSTSDEGDDPKVILLSLCSVYLADVCRDEFGKSAAISYIFRQFHPKSGWHQFSIMSKTLFGNSGFSELADRGTSILTSGQRAFKNYVHQAEYIIKASKEDSMRYEQFGWKNNRKAFLVGKHLFKEGESTPEIAYGSDRLEQFMLSMEPSRDGSLAGWTAAANRLFIKGCEAQAVACLVGLAAPFIGMVMGETQGEGGAILSLRSPGSGRGKSTALTAITSAWGEEKALKLIEADTYVAKFGMISMLKNLPVIYEELKSAGDPMFIIDFVKQFTSGRDKARGLKDGSVNAVMKDFQTIIITASNGSLLDAVSSDEGAVARVFEIVLALPEDFAFDMEKDIQHELNANAGFAGRALMSTALIPGAYAQLEVYARDLRRHYMTKLSLEGKTDYRYTVWMIAAIHLVGHLCNHYGILQFDLDRIMGWICARLTERVLDTPNNTGLDVVKKIINDNIMDCIVVDRAPHPKRPVTTLAPFKRNLKMRYEKDTNSLYISLDAMREWLKKANRPLHAVIKELEDNGVLESRNSIRALAAGTEWASAAVQCWKINMGNPAMGVVAAELVEVDEVKEAKSR